MQKLTIISEATLPVGCDLSRDRQRIPVRLFDKVDNKYYISAFTLRELLTWCAESASISAPGVIAIPNRTITILIPHEAQGFVPLSPSELAERIIDARTRRAAIVSSEFKVPIGKPLKINRLNFA